MPFLELPGPKPLAPLQPPAEGLDGSVELCSLGDWLQTQGGWTKIRSVMDSGAVKSVMPTGALAEYGIRPSAGSRQGQHFTNASGDPVPNEGEQVVPVVTAIVRLERLHFHKYPALVVTFSTTSPSVR